VSKADPFIISKKNLEVIFGSLIAEEKFGKQRSEKFPQERWVKDADDERSLCVCGMRQSSLDCLEKNKKYLYLLKINSPRNSTKYPNRVWGKIS
jgi:hypothetical protein